MQLPNSNNNNKGSRFTLAATMMVMMIVGSVNSTACPKKKECPTADDVCINTWGTFRSYFNNTIPCWLHNGDVWGCEKVTYNNWTECQPNQTNVFKDCVILPNPKPKCPRPTDTCSMGDKSFRADAPDAPNCWTPGVEIRFWSCTNAQSCPTSAPGTIDIKSCPSAPAAV